MRRRHRAQSADSRRRADGQQRDREEEPADQHDQLNDVDPRRAQEATGDEVDRHHDAADNAPTQVSARPRHVSTAAPAISWPARMASVPSQMQRRHDAAHGGAVADTRESRRRCRSRARRQARHMRGPIQNASDERSERRRTVPPPRARALAGRPRPAAPTVVPAPMLAASTVENSSGAVRLRPATKKSPLPRTSRGRSRARRPSAATE